MLCHGLKLVEHTWVCQALDGAVRNRPIKLLTFHLKWLPVPCRSRLSTHAKVFCPISVYLSVRVFDHDWNVSVLVVAKQSVE